MQVTTRGQVDHRFKEVVPRKEEMEQRHRHDGRTHLRQDYRPQRSEGPGAVDGRCLVKLLGNGQEVLPHTVGEIIVKSKDMMSGYWNNEKETRKTIKEGWLYTGDLATYDEDYYIYLVDRKKDMIISGGLNIYPVEIERVLYEHPTVSQCAVIGIPDDRWGEAVKALVVLKKGEQGDENEIKEFCKKSLAGYKKPKSVEFLQELPRNPQGKILKRVLREKYWKGKERKI